MFIQKILNADKKRKKSEIYINGEIYHVHEFKISKSKYVTHPKMIHRSRIIVSKSKHDSCRYRQDYSAF